MSSSQTNNTSPPSEDYEYRHTTWVNAANLFAKQTELLSTAITDYTVVRSKTDVNESGANDEEEVEEEEEEVEEEELEEARTNVISTLLSYCASYGLCKYVFDFYFNKSKSNMPEENITKYKEKETFIEDCYKAAHAEVNALLGYEVMPSQSLLQVYQSFEDENTNMKDWFQRLKDNDDLFENRGGNNGNMRLKHEEKVKFQSAIDSYINTFDVLINYLENIINMIDDNVLIGHIRGTIDLASVMKDGNVREIGELQQNLDTITPSKFLTQQQQYEYNTVIPKSFQFPLKLHIMCSSPISHGTIEYAEVNGQTRIRLLSNDVDQVRRVTSAFGVWDAARLPQFTDKMKLWGFEKFKRSGRWEWEHPAFDKNDRLKCRMMIFNASSDLKGCANGVPEDVAKQCILEGCNIIQASQRMSRGGELITYDYCNKHICEDEDRKKSCGGLTKEYMDKAKEKEELWIANSKKKVAELARERVRRLQVSVYICSIIIIYLYIRIHTNSFVHV